MSYYQPRLHIDLLDIVSASYSIAVISSYLDCSLGKFMCVLIFKNAPLPAISRKDWKKSISRHAFCPLFTAPLCSQSLLFQKDHDDFATLITVRSEDSNVINLGNSLRFKLLDYVWRKKDCVTNLIFELLLRNGPKTTKLIYFHLIWCIMVLSMLWK